MADYGLIVTGYAGYPGVGALLALALRGDRVEAGLLSSGTAICGVQQCDLGSSNGRSTSSVCHHHRVGISAKRGCVVHLSYIGTLLDLSQETFGAWVALAIHDTSSVVATAAIYGDEAAEVATTVKLGRTLWLIPLAFAVSLVYRRGEAQLRVPMFVLLFVGAALLSSVLPLGATLLGALGTISKLLLVLALGMIGLEIHRDTLRQLSLTSVLFGVGLC